MRLYGRPAFSLLELVIVIVIIGTLAAMAIPRMSGGSVAAAESALLADLKTMRTAIELYASDHGNRYPTSLTALARYTSAAGAMGSKKTALYQYGPYLREIPPCPTGPHEGATGWAAIGNNPPTVEAGTASVGWLYHAASGSVWVNDSRHFDK